MTDRRLILVRAALTFVLAFMVAPLMPAEAATAALLSWTHSAQNTDGSALTDLTGFRIRWGATPAAADYSFTVADPKATTYTVTGLAPGTWYLTVEARAGTNNILSAPTNPVSVVITGATPPPPPPPPSLVTKAGYAYCLTGTTTAPTLTSIGYVAANLACGITRVQSGITFCQIPIEQADKVIFCPGDPTLAKGVWARSQ